jgi:hypothetical protein
MKQKNISQITWVRWMVNRVSVCVICLGTATMANAHEVASTRINLVQRDSSHVSATFYVSPQNFFEPVVDAHIATPTMYVHLASLDDDAFAVLYTNAQTLYKNKISFKLTKSKPTQLSDWQFASWQSVKRQIQLDLAKQLVNSNAHAHMEPVQFSAQLTGNSELSVVQPKLPLHWGKVLVVTSKPQQRWFDSTGDSQWIKF